MNVLLLILFILLFILLVIVLPFKVKAIVHVNYMRMEAYYLIYLWIFNFLCGKAFFDDDKVVVKNKNNIITTAKAPKGYDMEFGKNILRRLKLANLDIFKVYGTDEDSMNTAIVCGTESVIIQALKAYLMTQNKAMNMMDIVEPNYTESQNQTSVYAVIKISILDVIISMIKAKLRVSKSKQEAKG